MIIRIIMIIGISSFAISLCVLIWTYVRIMYSRLKENQQNVPVIKSPKEPTFMEKWNQAVEEEDREKMAQLLTDQISSCRCKNSYCGTEMFCPECPHAGFVIKSGRHGL